MIAIEKADVDLTAEERDAIRRELGREPNLVEWGMFETMFSEHCSYKSSQPILRLLPTESPRVIVGPGYDSGIVDIGGGYAVAFKIESHNHPSAIEPYNGAATGIGGIVRDILCVGARPIALLDPLRFGPPTNGGSRWLLQYVVKGIGDYGNCIGVPTVAGEVEFDRSFESNCLVNVACVGLAKREGIVLAELRQPGDILVLAGGSTGRDGIHGVTFASKTLTARSEEDRSAVQIGDPFMKKLLIEAVLEAVATGYVRGLKDLGGGGLTCASSEMAVKGGTGVEINLDSLHVREDGMTPFELMLSESQERMLFAVAPIGLENVLEVLRKYEVPYSIVGRVTDTGELVVKFKGETVARLPPKLVTQPPVIERRARKPRYIERLLSLQLPQVPKNLSQTLYDLLSTPNMASKEWIYRQYDHEVGVRTVVKPGEGDAAVLRLLELEKAIAVKADGNSRHSYLDPFNGHAGTLSEAARNVVAVGAEPIAYVDCCNFGNPERPEVYWQFREGIKGLAYMGAELNIPCVGGNVSFYNEGEKAHKAVKPTTTVVTLGLIEDLDWVTTSALKEAGDVIVVVGATLPELGGSEYLYEIHGLEGGIPPKAYPSRERTAMATVSQAIRAEIVTAAHDCSKDGLAGALAVMAMQGRLGLEVELERIPEEGCRRIDELLFSESYARFLVTTQRGNVKELLRMATKDRAPAAAIGHVVDKDWFKLNRGGKTVVNCSVEEMGRRWREALPKAMGAI